MNNWKKQRNYRIIREDSGPVRYIISVDGQDIEVGKDVYNAYSQADRRERYLYELDEQHGKCSIEKFDEDFVPFDLYMPDHCESAEETILSIEELAEHGKMLERVPVALHMLNADERNLIRILFLENVSARKVARQRGITLRAVLKQRNRILSKIKRIFVIF